jgi:hypothetical protein
MAWCVHHWCSSDGDGRAVFADPLVPDPQNGGGTRAHARRSGIHTASVWLLTSDPDANAKTTIGAAIQYQDHDLNAQTMTASQAIRIGIGV